MGLIIEIAFLIALGIIIIIPSIKKRTKTNRK